MHKKSIVDNLSKIESKTRPDKKNIRDEVTRNIYKNIFAIKSFPNSILVEDVDIDMNLEPIKDIDSTPNTDEQTDFLYNGSDDMWSIIGHIQSDSDKISTESTDKDVSRCSTSDNISDTNICTECGEKNSFTEDNLNCMIICTNCGSVKSELYDQGPEWRQYNNDDGFSEGMSRCGCPNNPFFPKSSQGTIIIGSGLGRLRQKQKWGMMDYKERSLNIVFDLITKICNENNIPKIIQDDAKIFYKNISECKHKSGKNEGKQIITRGGNRLSIIASCVYQACKKNKNEHDIREISEMFGISDKKITKGNKHFNRIIKNSDAPIANIISNSSAKNNAVENYIIRHCNNLKMSDDYTKLAINISKNREKLTLASEHNPKSVAAGSILAAVNHAGLNIEKKSISKIFGISDVTITKIYNKLWPYIDILVDDEATDYIVKKMIAANKN